MLLIGYAAFVGDPPMAFWSALAGAVLVSALGAAFLARGLAAALTEIRAFSTRLAAGDLTSRLTLTREDDLGEVGRALNQLKANLAALVLDVRGQLHGLKSASHEITTGNTDLSRRTESQAASLEQTAASMEQLTTTVQSNAEASARALDLAHQAQAAAAQGGEIAIRVEQTMAAIATASHRIADITGVIDGIAFQTNLLALNAAVEAARAVRLLWSRARCAASHSAVRHRRWRSRRSWRQASRKISLTVGVETGSAKQEEKTSPRSRQTRSTT